MPATTSSVPRARCCAISWPGAVRNRCSTTGWARTIEVVVTAAGDVVATTEHGLRHAFDVG